MKYSWIFLLILLLPLAMSDSITSECSYGNFARGDPVNIKQTCANCTFNNITSFTYPNSSIVLRQIGMTRNDTDYNATSAIGSSVTGLYLVDGKGDRDGPLSTWHCSYLITNGGIILSTGESIVYLILSAVTLIGAIYFLYCGVVLPYNDKKSTDGTITRLIPSKYLKLMSFLVGYGALLWFMSIITGIANTFTYLRLVYTFMSTLFIFMYAFSYPLIVVIFVIMFIEVYKDICIPVMKFLLIKYANKNRRS